MRAGPSRIRNARTVVRAIAALFLGPPLARFVASRIGEGRPRQRPGSRGPRARR